MGSTRGSLRLLQREKPQLTLPLLFTSSQRCGGCAPVFPGLPARQATSGQQVARCCGRVAGRGCRPVGWVPGLGLLSTSVFTWRARSSPRHAPGLNVSFFLHPCRPPNATQAAGWQQVWADSETCDSRHCVGVGGCGMRSDSRGWPELIFEKSNFSNLGEDRPCRPRPIRVLTLQREVTL